MLRRALPAWATLPYNRVMTFAARLPINEVLTPAQLASVRSRPTWRGAWMIFHAWATIAAAIALVAWAPNPLTFVFAVMIIGSRQLGLGILMH